MVPPIASHSPGDGIRIQRCVMRVAEVNLKFASSLLELANVPWAGHDENQL